METDSEIFKAYQLAQEKYARIGIDTELALTRLGQVALSLHCWQGDDVGGFQSPGGELGGGLAATGNYPGKARTPDELRSDLDMAFRLIPGTHRLNLHAMYAETGGVSVERSQLGPEHFSVWADWAREKDHGIDFNPTCFSHPRAETGFTLSSYDPETRAYWIEHCLASRRIGEYFGRTLGKTCITNIWIPDGFKDTPVDRTTPRRLLKESLDEILAEEIDPRYNRDAIEAKLFGIGSESYVTGSHEFYLGYAAARNASIDRGATGSKVLLCLDAGHFHPTESIADKISSILLYLDEVLLHVSRGVRWDSDHVVIYNDDLQFIVQEVVRGGYLERVHIGLDYFDASINRVAAWGIGARNTLRALLASLLEPIEEMKSLERAGDYTARLAFLEELKTMPLGAVWDVFCLRHGAPVGMQFLTEVRLYEKTVLSKR